MRDWLETRTMPLVTLIVARTCANGTCKASEGVLKICYNEKASFAIAEGIVLKKRRHNPLLR